MALVEGKKVEKKSKKGVFKLFKEVKSEVKRITWAAKDEVKKSTLIVLFFCAVSAIIIALIDFGFNGLYRLIFK